MTTLYARPGQPLETHLLNTAELAKKFAKKFNAGELLGAAGLHHDYGKTRPEFLNYSHF